MNPTERHLEAARGWLYLGLSEEAGFELDSIEQSRRLDPETLKARARVFRELK